MSLKLNDVIVELVVGGAAVAIIAYMLWPKATSGTIITDTYATPGCVECLDATDY